MPTPLGHTLCGILLYQLFARSSHLKQTAKWVLFSALLAAAPDLDFIPGYLAGNYNVFHRGISHSIGGCAIIVSLVWVLLRSTSPFSAWKFYFLLLSLYGSHLVLDYFSKDTALPYGMKLLWPFSNEFIISPWPLFLDAHREPPQVIFSSRNCVAYATELILFGLPALYLTLRSLGAKIKA